MRPLTLDDLDPLDEYAAHRAEHFEKHQHYVDRYRRVRVGPRLTLIFENRQTLVFRVQEVLRVARLSEPARVEQELAVYNRLLPGPDRLQAALLIDVSSESRLSEELAPWQSMRGDQLRLCIGARYFPANLVTCRPEDRCIGLAHWVQFHVSPEGRKDLGSFRLPAYVEVLHPDYRHESALLSEDVRQSLLDDLALSDRD